VLSLGRGAHCVFSIQLQCCQRGWLTGFPRTRGATVDEGYTEFAGWLDPGTTEPARVADLLTPFDARLMKKYPVSTRVNSVNDDPQCAQEITPAEAGGQQGLWDSSQRLNPYTFPLPGGVTFSFSLWITTKLDLYSKTFAIIC
jgi:hypothetical protein